MILKNDFKKNIANAISFITIPSGITLALIVLIFFFRHPSNSEHFFYEKILSSYHDDIQSHNINRVEIEPSYVSKVKGEFCSVLVSVDIHGKTYIDDFLLSQESNPMICGSDIERISYHRDFLIFPEVYHFKFKSDIYREKSFSSVDLKVVRNLKEGIESLLPKVFEHSDKMRSDYQSIINVNNG